MKRLQEIPLNTDWWYLFDETLRGNHNIGGLNQHCWIPLPTLCDWAVGASIQKGVDWFRRDVILDQIQGRYILCIDKVPEATTIYINGQHAGDVESNATFNQDITPLVNPGTNVLILKLTAHTDGKGGVFGDVRLLPVSHLSY